MVLHPSLKRLPSFGSISSLCALVVMSFPWLNALEPQDCGCQSKQAAITACSENPASQCCSSDEMPQERVTCCKAKLQSPEPKSCCASKKVEAVQGDCCCNPKAQVCTCRDCTCGSTEAPESSNPPFAPVQQHEFSSMALLAFDSDLATTDAAHGRAFPTANSSADTLTAQMTCVRLSRFHC